MVLCLPKCVNYEEFSIKLKEVEKNLETETQTPSSLDKVLEFIKTNQEILIQKKEAAIGLDSLGAKVRKLKGHEPLTCKLRSCVKRLVPSHPEATNNFLQFLRNTIFDPSERLQAIAHWIDLVRIPLAELDLTEDEFLGLITRLEYPDLTNFDFQWINLRKLSELLNENLKFKTNDLIFLSTFAKFCAKKDFFDTPDYIHKFAIEDEKTRIEIAKLCAQQNGQVTANFIQNFAIGDEGARVEIAKLCAQQNGFRTAEYISKFAIENEAARIEIAMLCSEGSKYIQNFAIENEAARVEIASLYARKEGRDTARYIQNFEIKEEVARIKIAELCAQRSRSVEDVAYYIKKFAIVDEVARIEVAKLCALKNGRNTTKYFQKFLIQKEGAKIEIAKICAVQNGEGTAEYIHKFKFDNPKALYHLFLECLQTDPKSLFHIHNISSLPIEFMKMSQLIHILRAEDSEKSLRNELFEELRELIEKFSISKDHQKTILDMSWKIQALPSPVQNGAALWLVSSILVMREMKSEEVEWLLVIGSGANSPY